MARIAVVDDEKNIREVIRIALEKEFHRVEEYGDGLAAWEAFERPEPGFPDLIILDITMPRMDGIELCKRIRSRSTVPVIFLSSRDEEIDKVLGLESGADDYVSKPFSLRELAARIHAGLRRTGIGLPNPAVQGTAPGVRSPSGTGAGGNAGAGPAPGETGPAIAAAAKKTGGLVLDGERLAVFWNGKPLECTVTEFRILQCLVSPPGFIKTREQIMAAAFPEDIYPNDRAADSHIKRIRKKFTGLDGGFDELEAVYGLGYKWKEK